MAKKMGIFIVDELHQLLQGRSSEHQWTKGRLHRGAGGAAAPPAPFEEGQRGQEVP